MSLPCTGNKLPDIASVDCTDTATQIDQCCKLMQIEEDVLLYDQPNQAYYWVLLNADEIQLIVCNLEKYADKAEKIGNWMGRCCDYLVMGWYDGDRYIVIIELRHILTKEDQAIEKLDQVEKSIDQVISKLFPHIANSPLFAEACPQPENYKIAGIVIAPAGIRSIARNKRTRIIRNDSYTAIITMMPPERIKACKITWSELLSQITVASGRKRFQRH